MKEIKIGYIYHAERTYVIPIYKKDEDFLGIILDDSELPEVRKGDFIDLLVNGILNEKYLLHPFNTISEIISELDDGFMDYLSNIDLVDPLVIIQDYINTPRPEISNRTSYNIPMLVKFFGPDIWTIRNE